MFRFGFRIKLEKSWQLPLLFIASYAVDEKDLQQCCRRKTENEKLHINESLKTLVWFWTPQFYLYLSFTCARGHSVVPSPTGMVKPTSLLLQSPRVTSSMAMSKLRTGNDSWPVLISKPCPEIILEE